MTIKLTQALINKLRQLEITTLHAQGFNLPRNTIFEPPCSLKWMGVHYSLELGAFSYAVSGFYQGCQIGRYCSFGEQVQIGRHPHPMHWTSTSPFFYLQYEQVLDQQPPAEINYDAYTDFKSTTPPVIAKLTDIANDVWIGHGAFILPGVQIGNGAVIAAMSVVTKNVPPYAVVGGSPAKVIRYRFPDDQIEKLQELAWWEFAPWQMKGAPVDNIPAFIEFISQLRSSGESIYKPEKVKLVDLVAQMKSEV